MGPLLLTYGAQEGIPPLLLALDPRPRVKIARVLRRFLQRRAPLLARALEPRSSRDDQSSGASGCALAGPDGTEREPARAPAEPTGADARADASGRAGSPRAGSRGRGSESSRRHPRHRGGTRAGARAGARWGGSCDACEQTRVSDLWRIADSTIIMRSVLPTAKRVADDTDYADYTTATPCLRRAELEAFIPSGSSLTAL